MANKENKAPSLKVYMHSQGYHRSVISIASYLMFKLSACSSSLQGMNTITFTGRKFGRTINMNKGICFCKNVLGYFSKNIILEKSFTSYPYQSVIHDPNMQSWALSVFFNLFNNKKIIFSLFTKLITYFCTSPI